MPSTEIAEERLSLGLHGEQLPARVSDLAEVDQGNVVEGMRWLFGDLSAEQGPARGTGTGARTINPGDR